jgi:uncharacterized protein YggE
VFSDNPVVASLRTIIQGGGSAAAAGARAHLVGFCENSRTGRLTLRFLGFLLFSFALASVNLLAQSTARSPFVRATGQATVSVKPDQARISFSVVTQASTAQSASTENATQVSNVLSQLQTLLGMNADIKTIDYSLTPNYNYPQNGGLPTLIGYTASNTVRVTTTNLSIIGQVIDTGVQAGANQVSSLQFGLQDDQPAQNQALKMATAQAKAHADAMASGVGQHTGAINAIEEGVAVSPVLLAPGAATAPSTPIVTGLVDIQATVTIQVDLVL